MYEKDIEEIKHLLRENNAMLKEIIGILRNELDPEVIAADDLKDLLMSIVANILADYLKRENKVEDIIKMFKL